MSEGIKIPGVICNVLFVFRSESTSTIGSIGMNGSRLDLDIEQLEKSKVLAQETIASAIGVPVEDLKPVSEEKYFADQETKEKDKDAELSLLQDIESWAEQMVAEAEPDDMIAMHLSALIEAYKKFNNGEDDEEGTPKAKACDDDCPYCEPKNAEELIECHECKATFPVSDFDPDQFGNSYTVDCPKCKEPLTDSDWSLVIR